MKFSSEAAAQSKRRVVVGILGAVAVVSLPLTEAAFLALPPKGAISTIISRIGSSPCENQRQQQSSPCLGSNNVRRTISKRSQFSITTRAATSTSLFDGAPGITLFDDVAVESAGPTLLQVVAEEDSIQNNVVDLAATATATATAAVDPLSTQDILVGIVLAFLLAFLASFLQGQSKSSFPNTVLWTKDSDRDSTTGSMTDKSKIKDELQAIANFSNNTTAPRINVFNATDWEEMSQPENYIWYSNPGLKANYEGPRTAKPPKTKKNSSKTTGALIGLLLLFVPIFGAELFLALSRQFLCGEFTGLPWAQDLCAPIYHR